MTLQIVDFKTAAARLGDCMTFHPDKAMDTLHRLVAFADIAKALKEFKIPVPRSKILISINTRLDIDEVDDKIIQALGRLFPVDEDVMMGMNVEGISMFDDMSNCFIVPAYIGWSTTWDELAEAIDDGPGLMNYSESMSVAIFCGAYMNSFDEEEWNKFNEHFGWEVPWPGQHTFRVDLKRVYQMIDERKDVKFDRCFIEAIMEDTGLVFFDVNPYEEGYDNEGLFKWSYESIAHLAGQWKKAKRILDLVPRNYKVGRDPEQLKLLLELFQECRVGKRKKK